ncbi:MAG: alpha-L-fucosidase [Planctomycetota bacterium]|jgi:alpha-L-fucosidase
MDSKQWKKVSILILLLLFLLSNGFGIGLSTAWCAGKSGKSKEDFLYAKAEDTKWFREAKYGWLIHWGIQNLAEQERYRGQEVGWSRGETVRGNKGPIPVEVYDNLYKKFNPVEFDTEEWVEIAKDCGVKYITLLLKHLDGFCYWDSKYTDYDVMNTPFGRDVNKELADACHKAGMRFGVYISTIDVYDESYRPEFCDTESRRSNWVCPDHLIEPYNRHIQMLHGQVRELCNNYGKVVLFWFDHGGNRKVWQSEKMFEIIRRSQPDIIINNRAGLPGDFYTPEQRIGRFDNIRMWEGYISVSKDRNAWKPNSIVRTPKELVNYVVRTVGGDGNVSYGPAVTPTGRLDPRQVVNLKELGSWLKEFGRSIYATRGGPFHPRPWGASTYKDNTIFLHILHWDKDTIVLPAIKKKIISSSLMGGGTVNVTQTPKGIRISVPASDRGEFDTIVALKLDGPAAQADPDNTYVSHSMAIGKKATTSSWRTGSSPAKCPIRKRVNGPQNAFDDDYGTIWVSEGYDRQPWLEVDLGKPEIFSRVCINESSEDEVRKFELQYKAGSQWRTFHKGTRIGPQLTVDFERIIARFVRLKILKRQMHVKIQEFQLFNPEENNCEIVEY